MLSAGDGKEPGHAVIIIEPSGIFIFLRISTLE
jgi:hypothetical protein